MEKRALTTSWVAISLSVVTIALFFVKVTPNSVIDIGTFIGIIAALIGVSVTMLVGYQIYNVFEIKKELTKIDKQKQELEALKEDLNKTKDEITLKSQTINLDLQIQRCMTLAYSQQNRSPVDSFIRYHESLQYFLSSDYSKGGFGWYRDELIERMLNVDNTCFEKDVSGNIQSLKDSYSEDMKSVETHENYYIIQDWYEQLMELFVIRLDNIEKGLIVSPDCIDGFIIPIQ